MSSAMDSFVYSAAPNRVVFGSGTSHKLPEELDRLGLKAVVILSTPNQKAHAEKIGELISHRLAGVFAEAVMHTPVAVSERGLEFVRQHAADGVVSIGGGSTVGLGKAIGIRSGLPHICIPTTYAGSEMTPVLGETAEGKKTTRRDPKILPNTVLYDVDLTMTLPAILTATSGFNAIAHAVEALYAPDTNPLIQLCAVEGVKSLAGAMPAIKQSLDDRVARRDALYGAWLCGMCLGSTTMSLHHKICHILGGTFGLPHAETHTIVLPHVLAFNAPAIPDAMRHLAKAFYHGDSNGEGESERKGDPVEALNALLDRLDVKKALRDIGMKEESVDEAAAIVANNPYNNVRHEPLESIREMIRRAWAGEPARSDL